MNIAAAMAVLKLRDPALSGADKLALLVVACRAHRDGVSITRSLPALAADMGTSEATAYRATKTLAKRGYLQVSHSVGTSSTYTLGTLVNMTGVTLVNMTGVPPSKCKGTLVNMTALRRKTGERQEGDARPLADTAAVAAVDNPGNGSTWHPSMRTHPPECQCGGSGWLELDDGSVTKCEH